MSSSPTAIPVRPDFGAWRARRRGDIEVAAQTYGGRRLWGLKDPVALRYFHLTDEEFWLFEQLDGRTTAAELREAFERRFAPCRLDGGTLHAFLRELLREGLIAVDGAGQGEVLFRRRGRVERDERLARGLRLFAIRFRGVDPEPLLQRVVPRIRPLFSPGALLLAATLIASALGVFAAHAESFLTEAADLATDFEPRNLLGLMLVLGATRLIHEAAHAVACKHFGGECHEIGFMLFLLSPSAYCDVTSAWMIPNKWARMAVGAAGIGAELLLAAVAVLVWRFTEPGALHSWCLVVASLCTINTVLLNGNPLLRYDGYHVLTDWLEMPNLSRSADGVWRRWATQLWYGAAAADETRDAAEPDVSPLGETVLAAYALASKAYLVLVLTVSLVLFQRWADRLQLHFLGPLMTTAVVVGMAAGPTIRLARGWRAPRSLQRRRGRRWWLLTATAAAAVVALLFVPLPRSIHTTARLRPAAAEPIYVTQPGFLQSIVVGRRVAAGEVVAVLADDELQRDVVRLEADVEQAATSVANLESRLLAGSSAVDLPTARQRHDDLLRLLEQRREDRRRLTLRASHAGTVFPPPRLAATRLDPRTLPTWTGSPADAENRGAYLAAGVLAAEVGDPRRIEAVAGLSQADVLHIRRGAPVSLLADVGGNRRLTGRVVELGQAATALATADFAADPWSDQPTFTTDAPPEYQVLIALDDAVDDLTLDAPLRVKIDAPRESLWAKLRRNLAQVLRFD